MKIIYKVGDLLTAVERHIVHGCNAQGVMKSGVAKQIREKYYLAYRTYVEQTGKLYLGRVIPVDCGMHVIFNAITQDRYGKAKDVVYTDYGAIKDAMDTISFMMRNKVGTPVAMPLIGAGFGNGDWPTIATIIERASEHFQPVVYVLTEADLPKGCKNA